MIDGSWGAWAIEVEPGPFDPSDLRGLLEFCAREQRFRPLMLTGERGDIPLRRAGVPSMSWKTSVLEGPPKA